jgi:pimeloyl-ACP methyl ester carboxylesterase
MMLGQRTMCTMFAPLLPGYGDSEGAESLRDMLDITLHTFDVINALGLERPILVGHSMGVMTSLDPLSEAEEEVDQLSASRLQVADD